jgi:hypothetical protein
MGRQKPKPQKLVGDSNEERQAAYTVGVESRQQEQLAALLAPPPQPANFFEDDGVAELPPSSAPPPPLMQDSSVATTIKLPIYPSNHAPAGIDIAVSNSQKNKPPDGVLVHHPPSTPPLSN